MNPDEKELIKASKFLGESPLKIYWRGVELPISSFSLDPIHGGECSIELQGFDLKAVVYIDVTPGHRP